MLFKHYLRPWTRQRGHTKSRHIAAMVGERAGKRKEKHSMLENVDDRRRQRLEEELEGKVSAGNPKDKRRRARAGGEQEENRHEQQNAPTSSSTKQSLTSKIFLQHSYLLSYLIMSMQDVLLSVCAVMFCLLPLFHSFAV